MALPSQISLLPGTITVPSRQFWSSINRADYMALRLGFLTTHGLHLSYDFHNYMLRSMEEEFRDIVGIKFGVGGSSSFSSPGLNPSSKFGLFLLGVARLLVRVWDMGLPTFPRPTFGPSGLGLRFGLAQMGLYIALGAPLLWAWRVGLRAHFSNPIINKLCFYAKHFSYKLTYNVVYYSH